MTKTNTTSARSDLEKALEKTEFRYLEKRFQKSIMGHLDKGKRRLNLIVSLDPGIMGYLDDGKGGHTNYAVYNVLVPIYRMLRDNHNNGYRENRGREMDFKDRYKILEIAANYCGTNYAKHQGDVLARVCWWEY